MEAPFEVQKSREHGQMDERRMSRMTTKEKKRFWAKVLAFMLIASMTLSNLAASTTFAAAADEPAGVEESVDNAAKTTEAAPEEPKEDASKEEEPKAGTPEDALEKEDSEDETAEEESDKLSEEEITENDVNQEEKKEADANQDEKSEEEVKDDASKDDKTADLNADDNSADDSEVIDENVLEEEEVKEEVPEEVQAFLDAVAKIPEEITVDNMEEVGELLYGPVSDTYDVLLGTEYEEREDVQAAVEVMTAAFEKLDELAGVEPELYATVRDELDGIKLYYASIDDYYDYWGEQHDNGNNSVKVGEKLPYSVLGTFTSNCPVCKRIIVEEAPDLVCVDDLRLNPTGVIKGVLSDFKLSYYPGTHIPVPTVTLTGTKPGKTQVIYDEYMYYNVRSYQGYCNYCGWSVKTPSYYGWAAMDI